MSQGPHLRLLEKVKNPPTESVLSSILWRIGGIILFPLVLLLGLGLMMIIGMTSFLTRAFGKSKPVAPSSDQPNDPYPYSQWHSILEKDGVTLLQKNIGEIRFGPGYFALKSIPDIAALNDQIFGEWVYPVESGILLQHWNSTTTPDCNLLLLDTKSRTLRNIAKNIPSVQWRVESNSDKEIFLICDTGRETMKYSLAV